MMPQWAAAWGDAPGSATIRRTPEHFQVDEVLGFEPEGEGEHAFLQLEKRGLNTLELVERIAHLSGVPPADIGFSGMKDKHAVTRQWFSVGLAGRAEPQWSQLEESGHITLLQCTRHRRKLRRGVHRANGFRLRLTDVHGEQTALNERLSHIREHGVPNYFGPQRFGHNGSTFDAARRWSQHNRRITRSKRALYLSAIRGYLFNMLLSARVAGGNWNALQAGEVCVLAGTRSLFRSTPNDAELAGRLAAGDVHPGLPLWGRVGKDFSAAEAEELRKVLAEDTILADFLEQQGMDVMYRATRLIPDDFSWDFCDDGDLQLDFRLPAGAYATALLAETVQYLDWSLKRGIGSEQG